MFYLLTYKVICGDHGRAVADAGKPEKKAVKADVCSYVRMHGYRPEPPCLPFYYPNILFMSVRVLHGWGSTPHYSNTHQ